MKKALHLLPLLLMGATAFPQTSFQDATAAAGLAQTGKNYGIAAADFNNDGFDDLFAFRFEAPCTLYKNNGDGTFTDVAATAGVGYIGTPSAAAWADVDNDGHLDLFIGCRDEGNVLFRNNGNGTFTNITVPANVGTGSQVKASLFADVDRDGFVDLYLARFMMQNILYHNNGDGTFSDQTIASGATDASLSMGAVFLDYDNDNDPDLYLTHDGNKVFILYRNDGMGHFTNVTNQAGADVVAMGMGVDFGDINNDGWFDIYVTNLYENTLLLSNGDGTFSDIAWPAGVNDTGMGWGCGFLDADNDGWQDIYVANDSYFSPKPNLLYRNKGDNTFEVVSTGTPLADMQPGYGFATFDADNDGRTDLYLANYGGTTGNRFFRNQSNNGHHWVRIKAIGTLSNRAAIGARITLEAGGLTLLDEVATGSGYASQNSLTLHFGLGQATQIDKMTVRWPSGLTQVFEHLEVDRSFTVTEGEGVTTGVDSPLRSYLSFEAIAPNPFTEGTSFLFSLPESKEVSVDIYDLHGRLVCRLLDGPLSPGPHRLVWEDVGHLPKGMYFVRLKARGEVAVRRVVKNE